MANRREVLIGAAATSILATAPGAVFAGPSALAQAGAPVGLAIFDSRFAQARGFAAAMGAQAIDHIGFGGDLTAIWRDDLDLRWRSDRRPVAGVTTYPAFFCLEQFARDHRMRVVFSARHSEAEGQATHVLDGDRAIVGRIAASLASNPLWGPSVAEALAAPAFERLRVSRTVQAAAAGEQASPLLVSWLIAPARAA